VIEVVPSEDMQEDLDDMDSRHSDKRIKDSTLEEFNQIEDIEMRGGKQEDDTNEDIIEDLEERHMKDSILERLKDEGEEESSKDEQELKESALEEQFSKDDFPEEIITDEPEETITDDREEVKNERKKESSPEVNESEMVDIED